MLNQIQKDLHKIIYYPAVPDKIPDNEDSVADASFRIIADDPLYPVTAPGKDLKNKLFEEFERHTILLKDSGSFAGETYLGNKVKSVDTRKTGFPDRVKTVTGIPLTSNNREYIKEKILNNLGKISFKKLIEEEKEKIKAIAYASEKIPHFIEKVSFHSASLSHKENLKNKTTLKGLVFNSLA